MYRPNKKCRGSIMPKFHDAPVPNITVIYKCVKQFPPRGSTISTRHNVRLYLVPGPAGVRRNEIADNLARDGSVQRFVGPEPFLGVSRQNIRRKMKCWMENQHLVLWCGPCSTQRQGRELISGPDQATRA